MRRRNPLATCSSQICKGERFLVYEYPYWLVRLSTWERVSKDHWRAGFLPGSGSVQGCAYGFLSFTSRGRLVAHSDGSVSGDGVHGGSTADGEDSAGSGGGDSGSGDGGDSGGGEWQGRIQTLKNRMVVSDERAARRMDRLEAKLDRILERLQ